MPGLPDDRIFRLLAKADVTDATRARLETLVKIVDVQATEDGIDLQAEFGKEHVALIAGCNQFARFYRKGDHAGRIEVLPDVTMQEMLQRNGWSIEPAIGGAIFTMFGWKLVDPMQGSEDVMASIMRQGLVHAAAKKAAASLA